MIATRSEMVRARMEPKLKRSAESILSSLGMNPSQAIVLFYRQIEIHNGLPFDLRLPRPPIPDMATMTKDEFDAELQKGWDAAESGDMMTIEESRSRLHEELESSPAHCI